MILGLVDEGTWACDICKSERPSRKIGVAKHTHVTPTGVKFEENVKYCKDKMECRSKAEVWDLTKLNLLETAQQLHVLAEMLAEATSREGRRFWHGIGFGVALGLTIAWNVRWFG